MVNNNKKKSWTVVISDDCHKILQELCDKNGSYQGELLNKIIYYYNDIVTTSGIANSTTKQTHPSAYTDNKETLYTSLSIISNKIDKLESMLHKKKWWQI